MTKFRPHHAWRAFTLIELMLAIAVLAIMSSIVVINANAILGGFDDKPLPEILKIAVREARYAAAKNKEPVYLSFDAKESRFIVTDPRHRILQTFSTGYEPDGPSIGIHFFRLLPSTGTTFSNRLGPDRQPALRVAFHPDRSSTPFEVHLKYSQQESTHRYDPFSDAEFKVSPL